MLRVAVQHFMHLLYYLICILRVREFSLSRNGNDIEVSGLQRYKRALQAGGVERSAANVMSGDALPLPLNTHLLEEKSTNDDGS